MWALLLSLTRVLSERKDEKKKKIVIVGEGKVPESLDEGMRTSSCLPKTRLHNFFSQASKCDVLVVVEIQHDERTHVLPTSPFSHHFKLLLLNSSLPVAFLHHEGKFIKDTLQVDPELPRYPGPSLFTMSAFDGLVTLLGRLRRTPSLTFISWITSGAHPTFISWITSGAHLTFISWFASSAYSSPIQVFIIPTLS